MANIIDVIMDTQPVKAALGNHFEDLAFQIKGVKDMPAVVGTLEVIALLRQQHNEAENMRRMHHQEIITKLDAIEGRLDGIVNQLDGVVAQLGDGEALSRTSRPSHRMQSTACL